MFPPLNYASGSALLFSSIVSTISGLFINAEVKNNTKLRDAKSIQEKLAEYHLTDTNLNMEIELREQYNKDLSKSAEKFSPICIIFPALWSVGSDELSFLQAVSLPLVGMVVPAFLSFSFAYLTGAFDEILQPHIPQTRVTPNEHHLDAADILVAPSLEVQPDAHLA